MESLENEDSTIDNTITITPLEKQESLTKRAMRDEKKAKLIQKLDVGKLRKMSSQLSAIASDEVISSSESEDSSSSGSDSSNSVSDSSSSGSVSSDNSDNGKNNKIELKPSKSSHVKLKLENIKIEEESDSSKSTTKHKIILKNKNDTAAIDD